MTIGRIKYRWRCGQCLSVVVDGIVRCCFVIIFVPIIGTMLPSCQEPKIVTTLVCMDNGRAFALHVVARPNSEPLRASSSGDTVGDIWAEKNNCACRY
jgi:hypothetical protein